MTGLSEFELIEKFFAGLVPLHSEIDLGIGDDCAVVQIPPGQSLCLSMDTMVEGVHFPVNAAPGKIAYRALASAISDLAAMGARPSHFTLSLTLPNSDERWLSGFSQGLKLCCSKYDVTLVGGDTTKGPLVIAIQVHGFTPKGQELRRSGARIGDIIAVTGTLGDAGAALDFLDKVEVNKDVAYLLNRYFAPSPRIIQGEALRGLATSCIDISDGLLADMAHLADKSALRFEIDIEKLPLSESLENIQGDKASMLALTAGDDYELLFTIPESQWAGLEGSITKSIFTSIGVVKEGAGVAVMRKNKPLNFSRSGFQHFE